MDRLRHTFTVSVRLAVVVSLLLLGSIGLHGFDAHKNFARSLVATAPSPATSGTSLVVTTGDGSKFPAVPFNATIGPSNAVLTQANSEVVRVTGIATDTFTITRAQESSSARSVQIGDQIFAGPTAKNFTDIESMAAALTPGGRLTLTTGVPVTTADVTAATTLYYTAYGLGQIALYTGSTWTVDTLTEISIAVPATTSQMYDIFVSDSSGSPVLALVAWTNDSTPSVALTTQNGVLVETGVLTRRYVGSFRTTTVSGQTEDSATKRYVWNDYNRVPRRLRRFESTASWTYTTATIRQANGAAANQVAVVIGRAESHVALDLVVTTSNSSASAAAIGIGEDSTSAFSGQAAQANLVSGSIQTCLATHFSGYPAAGFHFYSWNEESSAVGTTTWYGVGSLLQSGLDGAIE